MAVAMEEVGMTGEATTEEDTTGVCRVPHLLNEMGGARICYMPVPMYC